MKFFRLFIFFILSLIIVTAILTFMLPTKQKVTRTIDIIAPASVVYEYIEKLENFNKWSVWTQQDSTALYTFTGTDGTIGAATSWKGHPQISGEGQIEITALEPHSKVVHKLNFIRPKKGNAESIFNLLEISKATTKVTWTFTMVTPRPWNIFNLTYSLDKQMGKDFEDGLTAMKTMMELSNADSLRFP